MRCVEACSVLDLVIFARQSFSKTTTCAQSDHRVSSDRLRRVRQGVAFATAFAAMPFTAQAQVNTDIERPPTLTIERYNEDWSSLAPVSTSEKRLLESTGRNPLGIHDVVTPKRDRPVPGPARPGWSRCVEELMRVCWHAVKADCD